MARLRLIYQTMDDLESYDLDTKYPVKRSVIFIVGFLVTAPVVILLSLISLFSLSSVNTNTSVLAAEGAYETESINIPEKPETYPSVSSNIQASDARVEIIKQYLERYNSPLMDYANFIVKAADENRLDFRLTTAIAQQESNLCKKIPDNTYNCWGWGIHSKGTLGFADFEEGIKTISRGLKNNYIDDGLVTVEQIMSRYTPHSPDGAWAVGVRGFMQDLQ